ncbi:MAG: zinc-finger domain-containing protein [Alphaproteobacteria bacterium]|nr:zinc-finger domain-containing protein [Alphaproteobacteria bacterium]
MMGDDYPTFKNDLAVREIRIGTKEFKCIGASPPHDHPHVYLNMGQEDTIHCSYCATLFRFDPQLGSLDADPRGCVLVN